MGRYQRWILHEGCSVTCCLQKNNFQLSRVVNFSKPPECYQRKLQSCFTGQLRKLKKESEVSLGSSWENGTLSKMKRPSWTSRILSEKASSSLCSTIFTSVYFSAFDGRHLSSSSIRDVSEVNVKFVAIWLKQWKRDSGKKMLQVLLITLYQIWNVQKRKYQSWEELSIFFFCFKNGLFTFKNWL